MNLQDERFDFIESQFFYQVQRITTPTMKKALWDSNFFAAIFLFCPMLNFCFPTIRSSDRGDWLFKRATWQNVGTDTTL